MGDGHVDRPNGGNPRLNIHMITEDYLKYIDEVFGPLSTGVRLLKTAKESAEQINERGFSVVTESGCSDVYQMQTRRHPELSRYDDWYSSGEKVWPEDIELTPTVLKHWYVCDGHLANTEGKGRPYITIGMSNEVNQTEKVSEMFKRAGLPEPRYNICESERYSKGRSCDAVFTSEESMELLKYIGWKPLPGFEYKWW